MLGPAEGLSSQEHLVEKPIPPPPVAGAGRHSCAHTGCVRPGHSRSRLHGLRLLNALRREGHLLGASPGLPGGGGLGAVP